MSIARKGSRPMVIRGKKFRWKLGNGVVAQKADGRGSKLLIRLGEYGYMEPGQVAVVMSYALDNGWEPDRTGRPFCILNGWELIPEYPLWDAVTQRDTAEVKALLEAGKDPNTRFQGTMVLNVAIFTGDVETVRVLLEAGANPNGDAVWIPLLMAIPNIEIIRLLLAYGADVNARDVQGHTALSRVTTWESNYRGFRPDDPYIARLRLQYEPIVPLLQSAGGTL